MTATTPVRTAPPVGERKLVPLDKLFVSKLNVRKHGPKEIDTLAASIAAQGLLQPLLVRPSGSRFEIAAGQRRWRALSKLKADKHPSAAAAVECIVRAMTDAQVIEASLAENVEREPMDVIDEFVAISDLVKKGQDEQTIAAHFGLTLQTVKRRLALGRLIPALHKLFRDQRIGENELQLLTLASKNKQKEYADLANDPNGNPPPHWQLKAWLLAGAEIAATAALFPLELAEDIIASDLFGQRRYFTDPGMFWELQNAAIAEREVELEAAGWTVELLDPQNPFRDWQYEKLAKGKGGRAVIAVAANGEVAIHKGIIHQDDLARLQKARGKGKTKDLDSEMDEHPITEDIPQAAERPELTEALSNYIELVRHSAVRAALTAAPATALRIAVAQLIGGSTHWRISPEHRQPSSSAIAEAIQKLPADTAFQKAQAAARKLLGRKAAEDDDEADDQRLIAPFTYDNSRAVAVYQRLTDLDDNAVLNLLTIAVAETLAVGTDLLDAVGADLKVEVLKDWQTGAALFDLIRDKEVLSSMVEEVAGKQTANSCLTATGAKKKEAIQSALSGKGRSKVEAWKPRWMAFPQGQYTRQPGALRA